MDSGHLWYHGCVKMIQRRPDTFLFFSTHTRRRIHPLKSSIHSTYMHPRVLGTIQMRAGSVRSIGLAGRERERGWGRSVCCMIMSSGVVGMDGNNRAPLCSSLCPSHRERESKLFPSAFPPTPQPPLRKTPFISTDTSSSPSCSCRQLWACLVLIP